MNRPAPAPNYGPALAVLSTVFFMWGFVTVLNDILIPHLKAIFNLNYAESSLIQFMFFSAYFLMSMPAAKVISWIGFHRSIVLGLSVVAAGALMFILAASALSFSLFLLAFFILASGITLLQVAANPYVSALGPEESSSSRLNLVQALNSLGTTVGPYVGGLMILSGTQQASSVKLPYFLIALLLAILAFVISRIHLPVLPQIEDRDSLDTFSGDSVWKHRPLVLGAIGIFAYVGAEVSIGSFLVNYFTQPEIANLSAFEASRYVSFYWGGAMVGRFIGSIILRRLRTGIAVGCAAIMTTALVTTSILTTGRVAMWSILAVGLFNSIMFPSIFTLGIDRLGKLTGKGSGILVMSIVGGAIIPLAEGALADRIGLQTAFFVPAVCYLYIVFYGFIGSRQPEQA
jgi:FHS family L-fucose permease-like MFS transporter